MARSGMRTIIAYCCLGAAFVGLGVVGAVHGVPANYGMTTAQALAVLDDRPVSWTAGWTLWSAAMVLVAVWRAWWLARHKPLVRHTAVRGSVWLWGATGAPWIYPWLAWNLPLYDFFNEHPPAGATPVVLSIATWWWLGAGLALLVGVVWSVTIAFRETPTITTGTVASEAPSKSAHPLLRSAPEAHR